MTATGRRRRAATGTLVSLVVGLLVGLPAAASSVVARSPAELFGGAERVVFGVTEAVGTGDDGRTIVTLRIERDLRPIDAADSGTPDAEGSPSPQDEAPRLRIAFGVTGATVRFADLPIPDVGDRVLWALSGDEEAVSPVVGLWQGAWTVTADGLEDLRGRRLVVRGEVVRLWTSDPSDGDVDAGDAIDTSVERVLAAIEGALADDGSRFAETVPALADGDPLPPVPTAPPDAAGDAAEPTDAPDASAPRVVPLAVPDGAAIRTVLEEAAQAWTVAGLPIEIREDPEAVDRIVIGDARRFGSDALVLLARAPGRPGVELWIRPDGTSRRADALAQALGRLLGLPPGAEGVAVGLVPADGRAFPSADDAAALDRRLQARTGDLDGDGDVDLHDLAAVAEAYGREGVALPADLDGSGRVDDDDLELLREAYEFLPPDRTTP